MRDMVFNDARAAVGGAVLSVVLAASSAAAATAAYPADVRPGAPLDLAAFERVVALRYDVHVRKAVAADIDRDGDLDVVAVTDAGFMVWVNDGRGHFTSTPPLRRPSIDPVGETSYGGDSRRVEEPIQAGVRPVPLPPQFAHAPPPLTASSRLDPQFAASFDDTSRHRLSRAPPR